MRIRFIHHLRHHSRAQLECGHIIFIEHGKRERPAVNQSWPCPHAACSKKNDMGEYVSHGGN